MKYAIFGDIHGNLEALTAVIEDARHQGCQTYLCLGDIVGFYANPQECVDTVESLCSATIKGDADERASDDSPIEELNPKAAKVLQWTRSNLSSASKTWLRKLPFTSQVAGFTLVHATLDFPSMWQYVMNKQDAMASMELQKTSLCFYGHTHMPRIYVKDFHLVRTEEPDLTLDPHSKYFVNVGSVGMPRDGDQRACYATFDQDRSRISIRRVDYDFGLAQQKVKDAGYL